MGAGGGELRLLRRWDTRFVLLLGASSAANWAFGLWIDRGTDASRRRVLAGAIAFNLGMLGFFKYFNFFADTLAGAAGTLGHRAPIAAADDRAAGRHLASTRSSRMAYAIDVYRRELEPARSLLDFAALRRRSSRTWSPARSSRPHEFLPQVAQARRISTDADAHRGLLPDPLGPVQEDRRSPTTWRADRRLRLRPRPDMPRAGRRWIGAATRSRCRSTATSPATPTSPAARAAARLPASGQLRPPLPRHRASPEFWRRWHISLSTWLRDYLYIPLGGNRRASRVGP